MIHKSPLVVAGLEMTFMGKSGYEAELKYLSININLAAAHSIMYETVLLLTPIPLTDIAACTTFCEAAHSLHSFKSVPYQFQ